MTYSKEFFQLQLIFAEKISSITDTTLETALLEYTTLYRSLQIPDWDFNSEHVVWQQFLKVFRESPDKLDAIYNFYLLRLCEEKKVKQFGCFAYDYSEERKQITMHLTGNGTTNILAKENREKRKEELRNMFREIKEKYPEVETVFGFSWLYNIDAYTRLFPQEYIQSLRPPKTLPPAYYRALALWGQFIDGAGEIRKEKAERFLNCIKSKSTLEEALDCFEYKLLRAESGIGCFFEFYEIE